MQRLELIREIADWIKGEYEATQTFSVEKAKQTYDLAPEEMTMLERLVSYSRREELRTVTEAVGGIMFRTPVSGKQRRRQAPI